MKSLLLARRAFWDAGLDAGLVERAVLHSRFQIFVKDRRGIVCDDLLLGHEEPADSASYVVIPLQGALKARAGRRRTLLQPGELLTDLRRHPRSMRQEGTQASLVVEWLPGFLGTRSVERGVSRLSGVSLERLLALASRLSDEHLTVQEASRRICRILSILRAEGLPFDPLQPEDLIEPVPRDVGALSRAIDRTLTQLSRGPSQIDLQTSLGCSRTELHRRFTEFQERYGRVSRAGWREMLHSHRLRIGAAMMSAPAARTESVSRLLGYASPKAFCYAFAKAGLPSPGKIREALRCLD